MKTDILVIGGGLSGLVATWQLRRAGVDARLIEARTRFGGRIWNSNAQAGVEDHGANCDLGPSWFWPGQPLVASLLGYFDIPSFEQYAEGTVLYQQRDGSVVRIPNPSPMTGSRRIQGGVTRLVNAIVHEIDDSSRFLGHVAQTLSTDGDGVTIDVESASGQMQIEAKQVGIAMPPRLATQLDFTPALPADIIQTLTATPTWMAGHAKYFAVYDTPFWRDQGLCGTVISHFGPLAEIHDASPNTGETYCLFGFAGLDAQRRAGIGEAAFIQHAINQLEAVFGGQAGQPKAVYYQDWSTEPYTASEADRQPQTRHPTYGLNLRLGDLWADKLAFISSETSFDNGGLIEGAIEAGLQFATQVAAQTAQSDIPLVEDQPIPHKASMDWDWLER